MAVELRPVLSSFVDRIGYDPESLELHVVYSRGKNAGQVTVHAGVPPEVAAHVLTAPSIGGALHRHIRGPRGQPPRYPHKVIGDG